MSKISNMTSGKGNLAIISLLLMPFILYFQFLAAESVLLKAYPDSSLFWLAIGLVGIVQSTHDTGIFGKPVFITSAIYGAYLFFSLYVFIAVTIFYLAFVYFSPKKSA